MQSTSGRTTHLTLSVNELIHYFSKCDGIQLVGKKEGSHIFANLTITNVGQIMQYIGDEQEGTKLAELTIGMIASLVAKHPVFTWDNSADEKCEKLDHPCTKLKISGVYFIEVLPGAVCPPFPVFLDLLCVYKISSILCRTHQYLAFPIKENETPSVQDALGLERLKSAGQIDVFTARLKKREEEESEILGFLPQMPTEKLLLTFSFVPSE